MEMIVCPNHSDLYCLLKTGTKSGPSHGLSFYVCTKCKFVKQSQLPPVKCTIHTEKTIELQSFVISKRDKGIRKYFRCDGREEGQSWCGFKQISEGKLDPMTESSQSGDTSENPNVYKETKSKENNNVRTTPKNNERIKDVKVSGKENMKKESNSSQCKLDEGQLAIVISSDEEDEPNNGTNAHEPEKKNPLKDCEDGKETSTTSNTDDCGNSNKTCQKLKNQTATQPLTFSDLSKTVDAPTPRGDKSFQNKSFHHYRDSPASLKTSHKLLSSHKSNSDTSDSDSDVEVEGTKELLQGLTIRDGHVDKKAVVNETEQMKGTFPSGDDSLSKSVPEDKIESQSKVEKSKTNDDTEDKKKNGTCEDKLQFSKPTELICASRTNENKNDNQLDFDPYLRLRNLKDEKARTVMELNKFQSSMRAVKLETLPDKGQKLLARVSSFKQHISSLDRQIAKVVQIVQERGQLSVKEKDKVEHKSQQPQVIRVYPGANNTTVVHVKSSSNQVMSTSNSSVAQNEASDSKDFQPNPYYMNIPHLYAANPQAMTLYGGRMTAQRLREVGSITTEAIEKLHKQLESCPSDVTELPDPDGLLVTLMSHQRQALAWLEWREQQHPPGGILADDMGLGKTLTMISLMLRKKQEMKEETSGEGWLGKSKQVEKLNKSLQKSRATLVVAPASLVHQWAKEIERRCKPRCLKFLVYHGPNRENNIHRLANNDVVLTTYAIVSKEVGAKGDAEMAVMDDEDEEQDEQTKAKQPLLLRIGWERIILDEAHDIKNHKSARSQSVCRLRAAYRWALTGTPIQNDLKDMYSLLRFLRFSPFDEWKVWKKHIETAKVSTKRLNTIVKALLLRRTKDQTTLTGKPLVELPNKTYESVKIELGEEERKIYDKLYRKTQSTVRAYVHRHQDPSKPDIPGSQSFENSSHISSAVSSSGNTQSGSSGSVVASQQGQGKRTGSQILVFLLRLRQCCSHLSLMKSHLESESVQTDGIELSLEQQMKGLLLEEDLEVAPPTSDLPHTSLFEKTALSTKLSHVMRKINDLQQEKPKDKSVIMSQWTGMLEIVAHHLIKSGISYSLIQGNVPAKKRAEIVDDFNSPDGNAMVLLVSLCAGGVGLNLIGGNNLFLLDNHWNPALEEQACDRIYRIGQKKDVTIYRFICKDTIEEKIIMLQQGKLSLAKTVLSGAGAKNQKLSLNDLCMLFGV